MRVRTDGPRAPGGARTDAVTPAREATDPSPASAAALEPPAVHAPVPKPEGRPAAPRVRAEAEVGPRVFDRWLKVDQVTVTLQRGGLTERQRLNVLVRPGHDSTHVATLRLHGKGAPTVVYKDGDTRPAAALRGTPYVATGIIAGALDHHDVDPEATALMEIAEEVGGEPLGRLVALGAPMATMPVTDGDLDTASTESDHYFVGVLSDRQSEIHGDGFGLELPGLLKPLELSIADAMKQLDAGAFRENARARVALSRALDKAGFVPQLNAWVRDLPPALQGRFDNLGLGEPYDPRKAKKPAAMPPEPDASPAAPPAMENMQLAPKVNAVDLGDVALTPLGPGAEMLDSHVRHLAPDAAGKAVPVGRAMPMQSLHTDFDRLKLACYVVDHKRGPLVRLSTVERPLRIAKAALTGEPSSLTTQDVADVKVPLPRVKLAHGKVQGAQDLQARAAALAVRQAQALLPGAKVETLSAASYASPGQADLQYHFLAARLARTSDADFVPLSEALRRCRAGAAGDANTEALLLRLADHLGWVPQLEMSVADARRVVG
ncbi:MAG: hypothetical protein IPJ65_20955 [Archangiaceae bacterium]|nr:hypothetical protein [Archangiaceae bacterium]